MGERFVVQVYMGDHTAIAETVLHKAGVRVHEKFTAYGHPGSYPSRDDYLRCELPDEGMSFRDVKRRLKTAEMRGKKRIADFDILYEDPSFDECTRFPSSTQRIRHLPPSPQESAPRQRKMIILFAR